MARPSVRGKLLDAGFELLWRNGYGAAGVRDIVSMAGARPGSFTNHFASKEDFVSEVLDRYCGYVNGVIKEALSDATVAPASRLRRCLDALSAKVEEAQRGCMAGNLSLEVANHSERLRGKLAGIFEQWRDAFADCVAQGQRKGEITRAFSAGDLAEFLLSGWQGAILRMKVTRSPEPLERFKAIAFGMVLGGAGDAPPRASGRARSRGR
jgi:TetR/AcrR family transcriptional repressor of nem operon